jgi:flavin-dependent dehydrogenase
VHPRCEFDVLVFGDGPAGLACGLAGLAAGLSVAVVAPARSSKRLPMGEHLTAKGRTALERLGVSLPAGVALDCPRIEAYWGSEQPRFMDYLFSPFGSGLNVLRPAFERCLLRMFAERGGCLPGAARLRRLTRCGGRFEVDVEGAARLEPRWLVYATGRACALARRLGVRPVTYDRMIGLVADVDAEPRGSAGLTVEASEHGWCYAVALAGGGTRVVALTDGDLVRRAAGGAGMLGHHLVGSGRALRQFGRTVPHRVEVVPARTQRLDRSGGEGWLAVGDAAMAFDPLTSNGIAKALDDGLEAIAAIVGGEAARRRRAARLADRFERYCREHRGYYRLDRRWPDSTFWRRRHAGALGTQPIVLDPETLLQRADGGHPGPGCYPLKTGIGFPLVDPEPILRIATRPLRAHFLVRHARTFPESRGLTDHERIGLVQTLISIGALRIIEADRSSRVAAF